MGHSDSLHMDQFVQPSEFHDVFDAGACASSSSWCSPCHLCVLVDVLISMGDCIISILVSCPFGILLVTLASGVEWHVCRQDLLPMSQGSAILIRLELQEAVFSKNPSKRRPEFQELNLGMILGNARLIFFWNFVFFLSHCIGYLLLRRFYFGFVSPLFFFCACCMDGWIDAYIHRCMDVYVLLLV